MRRREVMKRGRSQRKREKDEHRDMQQEQRSEAG